MSRRDFIMSAPLLPAVAVQEVRSQVAPAMFVIAMAVVGGSLIFYLLKHGDPGTHRFALQKRDGEGEWHTIAYNTLRLPPERFYAAFQAWQERDDKSHMFRVVEVPLDEDWLVPPAKPEAKPIENPYPME